ncbi:MAG TPA: hypothetical protein VMD56_09905, partial [Steroidobacteraceae bacterium]|nr:hypothetical protein [Steroidobacteraceae bacterium]
GGCDAAGARGAARSVLRRPGAAAAAAAAATSVLRRAGAGAGADPRLIAAGAGLGAGVWGAGVWGAGAWGARADAGAGAAAVWAVSEAAELIARVICDLEAGSACAIGGVPASASGGASDSFSSALKTLEQRPQRT